MKLCPKCQKQFSDDANFCPVDAARLVPLEGQPEAAAGADPLTQRFKLGERLGGSRTGAVHRAADTQGGGAAAVKLISPAVVALPGVAQRLERELKQLERVHSAGVARVLSSGRRGEDWWVAYELVEGAQTLAEAITARGPIPLDQAAHLIEVIGEALIEAAQVGVVHRDLAPKNVLFAGHDIKLINFSVPVPTDRTPGVPEFVAPEQVDGKAVDQRSNLYSLGALYYYVLTGQPVHAGSPDEVHRAHVSGSIRTPSSLAQVPSSVEAIIMRALDRSPTKRFLTVRQFVDEVGRVARGEASVRSTQPMGKAGRPKAELVQTLLGVRGGMPVPAAAPAGSAVPAAQAIASEPHPGTTIQGVGSGAAIAVPQAQARPMEAPPFGVPAAAPAEALPPPERSPWAPPGTVPPGQPAPEQVAAPAPQPQAPAPAPAPVVPQQHAAIVAPEPSAPQAQVPAPAPAAQAPGKATVVAKPRAASASGSTPAGKKAKSKDKGTKGKFRETLWFKKGDLDAQAAQAAAEERARTGRDTGGDPADSRPIDERYKDDGTVSHEDKEKYSLRTGGTEMMPRLRDPQAQSSAKVSEDELIGEMKSGRGKILALIGVGVVVLIVIVVLVAR
jgi:hypothetical protein